MVGTQLKCTSLTRGLSSKSLAFGKAGIHRMLQNLKFIFFFFLSLTPTQSLNNNGKSCFGSEAVLKLCDLAAWELISELILSYWHHSSAVAPQTPAQNTHSVQGANPKFETASLSLVCCQLIAHQIKHFLKQLIITTIFLVPTMCQADSRTPSCLIFSTSLEAPVLQWENGLRGNVQCTSQDLLQSKAVTNMGPQSSVWFQPSRFKIWFEESGKRSKKAPQNNPVKKQNGIYRPSDSFSTHFGSLWSWNNLFSVTPVSRADTNSWGVNSQESSTWSETFNPFSLIATF